MAEAITLAKIFMFLGVMFAIAGMLYPGSDASWNALRTRISGEGFPTFTNPFAQETFEANFSIVGDGSAAPDAVFNTGGVPFCVPSATPAADWWGCLLTKDATISYNTDTAGTQSRVQLGNIQGVAATYSVLAIKINVQCRGNTFDRTTDFIFRKADDTTLVAEIPSQVMICPKNTFTNLTSVQQFDTTYPLVSDFNGGTVQVNPNGSTDYSFLDITVIVAPGAECAGTDTLTYIGCVINGFFNFLVKGARFIFNGIIFIFQLIGFAIFFVIDLFSGIIGAMAFLIGVLIVVPILGPVLILVMVGMILWFFYTLVKLVSGIAGALNPV